MNILIDSNGAQAYQTPQTKKAERPQPAAESTAADAEVQKSVAVSNQGDRVEISSQGRAALAQSAVVSTEQTEAVSPEQTAQIDQAQRLQAAKAGAQDMKAAVGMAQEAPKEEETATEAVTADPETASDEAVIASASTTDTNLTALTEEQIQSLVSDGTISQAEANTELARRAAAEQAAQQAAQAASATEEPQEKADPVQQAAKAYTQFQQTEGTALLNEVA